MTHCMTTSHTDKRNNGTTVTTTEYFDTNNVLVKKQLHFFNSENCLTLVSVEDFLSGMITELKPKPKNVQSTDENVCFIKTVYNKKYYMMSQGTADKDGEYHGIVSVFKSHKTRYEEYCHGHKIADHTHPVRDRLIKMGIIATIAGMCAFMIQKCEHSKNVHREPSHIRMHE